MGPCTWAWSALLLKKCQRYGRWLPNLFRKQNIITALQVNKPARPLWQRSWTWQVQNRGLLLINATVYSGLPEVVHILPNCLHSILNRYSFILIQSEFTFKQAQHSHSQHMVILATPAVLHYNTGGLCDALHRTKRISSLFLFLPLSLFPSPLPSSLAPYTHTDTETTTNQSILGIPQHSACRVGNRSTSGKSSLFSLSCSRLQSKGVFSFSFFFFYVAFLQQRTPSHLFIITHV